MAKKARDPSRGWGEHQVKAFVFDAIQRNKAAWDIVPSIRRAIVAEAFASVVTALDRTEIPVAYLENLWSDMCTQATKWGLE